MKINVWNLKITGNKIIFLIMIKIILYYDDWNYTGPTDYYGTGTMRIVEYYPNLDIYKIKANWGVGPWTLNT